MIINSFDFLWIFPIIFIIYSVITAKRKHHSVNLANIFLLIVSYGLFWYYNKFLLGVLVFVTLATWTGALCAKKYGSHRGIMVALIILGLAPLLLFKYYNFFTTNINLLFKGFGIDSGLPGLNLAIPLGISFFTLQAVGYLIDVIKGKIEPERNLMHYMLFVSFFPQITSGPISRASDLLPQIKSPRPFDYDSSVRGLKWLLWGMFIKVVVADNIGELIHNPLQNSSLYTSWTVIQSVILYSIQIYCDFAGYSFMAIGIGLLFGFNLINNFERPYFAASVTEFWHRWHRSLSLWLRDYVYIPLGGSRCSKLRNYLNIFATFLVSGLWHGANWTFVLWGGMHGAVQVGEKHLKLNKTPEKRHIRLLRILTTFILVTVAWIFFSHSNVDSALTTIRSMFTSSGKKTVNFLWVFILAAIVLIKDYADEYEVTGMKLMDHKTAWVRWLTYSVLIFAIMVLSVYGEKFIYSGF